MTATFVVTVDLDAAAVELEAKRRGFPSVERAVESVLADCECRLHDALRFRTAVERAGVQLLEPKAAVRA